MTPHGSVVRPVDAVAGLVPDQPHAIAALAALHQAGHDAVPVRPRHAVPGTLREWGPDTTILNLFLYGLDHGHILLVVPATPATREEIGRNLSRHQGHALYYFTPTTVESLSAPARGGDPADGGAADLLS